MAKKKAKKKTKSKGRGLKVAPPVSNPAVNFADVVDKSPIFISGTACDLVRDGHDIPAPWWHNHEAHPDDTKTAFLVGRGYTATKERIQTLHDMGIPWMAINDYPMDGPRPNWWCTGDPASYFRTQIWDDPELTKFCAMSQKKIARPRNGAYDGPKLTSLDAPNTHFFHHVNNGMEIESWLHQPYITWGTTLWGKDVPAPLYSKSAARSSLFVGLRLLWHLGYRDVFLLGCDCEPHKQEFSGYWPAIFHQMEQLKPTFDRWRYDVYQTNRNSYLRSFEYAPFDEVVKHLKEE